MTKKVVVTFFIDRKLKNNFKAFSARAGMKMSNILEIAIINQMEMGIRNIKAPEKP